MDQFLKKLEMQLEKLTQRDQIALSVIVVIALIFVWDSVLRSPLSAGRLVVEHDIQQVQTETIVIEAKIKALTSTIATDPDIDAKQQLTRFIDENKRLDIALAKTSVQVISPQEMNNMLEQILASQAGLKFVSLKNMPATPEFTESKKNSASTNDVAAGSGSVSDVEKINTIYRHSVILQMEGSYHSVLSYLKKLEQFPWRFFWQGIEIETREYPNSTVTLEVYTLGFREGIIGV